MISVSARHLSPKFTAPVLRVVALVLWTMQGLNAVSTAEERATGASATRVRAGLVVLYTFGSVSPDGLIHDRSGAGEPLNLRIDKPQGTLFRSDRLFVSSAVTMASDGPAARLSEAIQATGELTIEVWLKPLELRQSGPARIVSLSADPSQRNFTLGQDHDRLDFRLRTTATDDNGIPSTSGPEHSLQARLTHVVVTRSVSGAVVLYQDGKIAAQNNVPGELRNWGREFRLSVANEVTGDRPWLGDLHLIAIYSRPLTESEVRTNFQAGVPAGIDYARLLPPVHAGQVDFVRDVQPIFRAHCFECHAADQEDGGVNLGIRHRALQGGHHGPIFEAGNSAGSRLIHLVAALDEELTMPPDSDGLTPHEVGLLRAWIDQGAVWPEGTDTADPREEKARQHWAFQPPKSPVEPPVRNAAWPQTVIDRFVIARLEEHGLAPQVSASSRQLVRRMFFDLIGLPPTPEETDAFCEAAREDRTAAIAEVADRLLASPHYGERWGRHWLDVARYADSDGQESDRDRPTAWHYRDYVIRAFNNDQPWDEFVRWQLAGDEYEPDNPDAVAATGFLAAGPFAALPDRLMEDERLRNRYNELDDMLSTIGTGFLGLTLGCVRCHDHKYDAIPARDYYSLLAAFHSGERAEVPLANSPEKVLAWRDLGAEPGPSWLFQRGNYYDRDQPVSLGFVSMLTSGRTPDEYLRIAREQSPAQHSTRYRRAVADWITDPVHGAGALLARVVVNRIWQQHFGHGIVRTPGDFGVRSDAPSHPELLEWLAHDLISHGWRIKRLQRLILTSAVYQQQSAMGPKALTNDSENRLLSRMPLMRLEGEILRDSMLAVSGTLNPAVFGPAVKVPVAAEAVLARNLKDKYPDNIPDSPELRRRSVYLFHKRVVPYPLLQAFDKPDAQQTCSRRDHTTVAPQALALLNDPFVRGVASDFASRLERDAPADMAGQIQRAWRLAVCRMPDDQELAFALQFLHTQFEQRRLRTPDTALSEIQHQALTDLCQVIFGLNEFLYVD